MKLVFACLAMLAAACAENGRDGWLRYAPVDGYDVHLPAVVTTFGDSETLTAARQELIRGVQGMLGRTLRVESGTPLENAIVLAQFDKLPAWGLSLSSAPDAYWLKTLHVKGQTFTVVTAGDERGVLYGVFALLRKIALRESIEHLDEKSSPYAPVRWVNQWDNIDG